MSNVDLEKEERGKSKSKRKMPGDFLSNVECRMSNVECRMSNVECQSSKLRAQSSNSDEPPRPSTGLSPVGISLGGDERE